MIIKNFYIIANPTAHSFSEKVIETLEKRLKTLGPTTIMLTTQRGDASKFVQKIYDSLDQGRKIVFCYGGDGTMNEVIQNAVNSSLELAYIPGGTVNLLAKEIELNPNPLKAIEQIISSGLKSDSVAVGEVLFDGKKVVYFLDMVGVGVDANICKNLNIKIKKTLGVGSYLQSALKYLLGSEESKFRVRVNQGQSLSKSDSTTWAVMHNGKYYGGSFSFNSNKSIYDNLLGFYVNQSSTKISLIYSLLKLVSNSLQGYKTSQLLESALFEIKETDIPVQVDGDYIGETPITVKLIPNAIQLISPKK